MGFQNMWLQRMSWRSRHAALGLAAIVVISAAGCGKEGPERYRLSGAITWEGKPVPSGMVTFEPASKGIGGGFAPIVNGTYDTDLTGRGHLGGEHTVSIAGFAGTADPNDPDSAAVSMFKPVTFTSDLPKESSTMDLLLPRPTTP